MPAVPELKDTLMDTLTNGSGSAVVKPHKWGEAVTSLGAPFDVIVACGKLSILHSSM